jgi:hypothetical protein
MERFSTENILYIRDKWFIYKNITLMQNTYDKMPIINTFDCPYEELINHINYLNDEVKRIRKLVLFA